MPNACVFLKRCGLALFDPGKSAIPPMLVKKVASERLRVALPMAIVFLVALASEQMLCSQIYDIPTTFRLLPTVRVFHVCLVAWWGNWKRTEVLYNSWGREFIEKFRDSTFVFGALVPDQDQRFSEHTIVVPSPEPGYRCLWYMYNEILKIYLNSTNLPWIVRTTEDCFVNNDLFQKYFERLNAKYDPYKDVVVKGQVVPLAGDLEGPMFVHGGSGWILSRAAAVLWLKHLDELNQLYAFYPSYGDDVFLDYFRKMIHLRNRQIDAVEFIGSPLAPEDGEMLAARNYSFPVCPDVRRSENDKRFIKKAVFWHSGDARNLQVERGKEIQSTVADNLILDTAVRPVRLCYLKE